MTSQEKLIELVGQRYTGDVTGFLPDIAEVTEGKKGKTNTLSKNQEEKQVLETEKDYKEALAYIKDIISPAFFKAFPDKLRINNTYVKTFFIYAYPNFLEGNWLAPVINWDIKFDMSMYVYPIESAFVQKYLKKRLTQLHSERSINAEK